MAYGELNLQPIPKMANGRFRKGNKPHNKGKKWSEWMDGRKHRKVLKGLKRTGRKDIGGWNAKKVVCLLDGKFIGCFDSAKHASEKTGIQRRNICAVCNGKRPKAGGYQWYFESDNKWIEYVK